ncbi:MAG: ATP-binding cassette domain-containing protein [bacterium]|nr:ATP-binding cassette domain-containing protein [bacterium]
MILFEHATKSYPVRGAKGGAKKEVVALDDVTLEIATGEFVSIVGQSGAGKSTLLRLLFADEQPTNGSVSIDGWDITTIRPWQIPHLRRQIGVVFQDFKLLQGKTVFENVSFAMEVGGSPTTEIRRVVPQLLKLVNLSDKAEQYPWQLSGGEGQRTSLARGLAFRPKILIADEPTGNLDALHAWDLLQLLLKINKLGTTVLLASHDEAIVNAVKRRVVTLERGKVVKDQKTGTYEL